ncbi:MAG: NADH-quinone oxidoreductase subunit L [Cyanothece sp. SIO2G6]|nr:NADH-quinone oxidoreductase subunit L [Cyanothece sp. SIO2G6]
MDINELHAMAEQEQLRRKPHRIRYCTSAGCVSAGAIAVKDGLKAAVKDGKLDNEIEISSVGCMGLCARGPLVKVEPSEIFYENVTAEQAASVVSTCHGGATDAKVSDLEHPFWKLQQPIVLENRGRINPERIEEYVQVGGYQSLHKALTDMTPAEVVEEMKKSGLRGRGGGGYPTGLKWETVAKMPPGQKYVICNADEGDPGAFMDRSILESDPHRVLEGMAIAGYAVGATHGFVYTRAEYPLAIKHLQKAIKQAKKFEFLGSQIFGSGFDFKVDIRIGAGAFVCGEETALMHSIQGARGNPRPRPPYPAASGLWDCPTLINNVESFANVAPIVRNGGDWYASIGTEDSKGTKVFALTGKITNTGLIEVPMGTTLRQIVEEMGDGVPDGGVVKAVQTGGPSGGCVPADLLDTPVEYKSLLKLGAIMGSGGMIVMDEGTKMVEIARFYMEFCREETCGKCVPCRTGTVQLYELLDKISKGQGTAKDVEQLEKLSYMVKEMSLCGLGQTAPNPILSTLDYFKQEYLDLLQSPADLNGNKIEATANAPSA